MYYRFFVFMAVVAIAISGVAQAQVGMVSQDQLLAPIPDSAPNSGDGILNEDVPAMVTTTVQEDGGYSACGDQGCCDYCPSTYCTPHLCTPCGAPVSKLLFGSEQNYGGPCTSPYFFHKGQFVVQSWLDQGYTWNSANPNNRSNLPTGFNDRANEYEMNQLYVVMQRKLDHRKRWDWGARVDLFYGTDYVYTQATGLELNNDGTNHWNGPGPRETLGTPGGAAMYGVSMPQLYAEFLAPMGYGTTVKVGHFYSIMGHESVMAPENFFYSHTYSMLYGEPFTHTGVLCDYQLRPNFSIRGGIVRGWDAWEDPEVMGRSERRVGFLGGLGWESRNKRTAIDFNIYTGNEQFDFVDGQMQNRTNYSLVLKRKITSRFTYVMQHDFGSQRKGSFVLGPEFNVRQINTNWYSLVNYMYYKLSNETSLGFRFEWFKDPEISRVLQLPTPAGSTGSNYYAATFGINWKPFNRCVVRPEVRWDWSDVTPFGTQGAYNEFTDKNQFTLGLDVLYNF
ncbi:MAG: porin [Planctomycetia bacterium]|jgi:hypothetical protein